MGRANTSHQVFADSAYRSKAIEAPLKADGFISIIHRRRAVQVADRMKTRAVRELAMYRSLPSQRAHRFDEFKL